MIGAGKLADKCASPNAAAKIACEAEVKKYSAMGTPLAASGGFTSELAGDLQCTPGDAFKKALQANQQFAESYGKLASILCLGENSLSVEDVFGKQAEAPVVVAPAAVPVPAVAPTPAPVVAPVAPAAPVLGAVITPPRSALDEAAEAGEDEDDEAPTAAQLEARATELERKAAEKKEKAEKLHAEQIELHVAIATDATNRPAAAAKWNEFKIAEREAKVAEKAAKKARVEADRARAEEGAPKPESSDSPKNSDREGSTGKKTRAVIRVGLADGGIYQQALGEQTLDDTNTTHPSRIGGEAINGVEVGISGETASDPFTFSYGGGIRYLKLENPSGYQTSPADIFEPFLGGSARFKLSKWVGFGPRIELLWPILEGGNRDHILQPRGNTGETNSLAKWWKDFPLPYLAVGAELMVNLDEDGRSGICLGGLYVPKGKRNMRENWSEGGTTPALEGLGNTAFIIYQTAIGGSDHKHKSDDE